MGSYLFSDTRLTVDFDIINSDPGWYNIAGGKWKLCPTLRAKVDSARFPDATNGYGTRYTCRMDNGRQIYSSCFSNYYCM
jgi:hypothetical protein